ncbi:TniQ family protein [Paucisalibacillus sp. EB02]|uniref:TniQ family protein n=1 Tax=Paucisalibacillus sp. EB02 TaxID=1347087 RepID=UPI0004AD5C04|nr:TniQ family protein [Paucisalibacillus sp. EB02]
MERSILYNIKPIGLGTPFVESLTSYITRIAEAHCVLTGDLIFMVYAPLLNKEYLSKISKRGGNGFFDSAIGMNGRGKLAKEFIELTEKLTGRSDISFTTLFRFSSILPERGLLKRTKSWCPKCYEESKLKSEDIYDQLIWNFQCVDLCIIHKTPLLDLCEHCKYAVPLINRKSMPGYCSRCGNWLGSIFYTNDKYSGDTNEFITDIMLIGELLAKDDMDFSNANLGRTLNYYVTKVFEGSQNKAAKYMNIPKSTFRGWISGETLPNIYYQLRICKVLGVSIIDLLQRQEPVKKLDSSDTVSLGKKSYDHEEIKKTLNKVIMEKTPVSISAIAKIIGCDRKLLTRMYEIECNKIKENYNAFLKEKKAENLHIKNEKLKEAFNSLLKKGVYPSRRRIEETLGTGFLREKIIQDSWDELKRSHDV